MANFPGLVVTNAGLQIQAKAQTGQTLQFSRVAVGDGNNPADWETLTALVNEKQSLDIQDLSVIGDGTTRLRAILNNQGLQNGFFIKEVGIFALDPDTSQETLYSYSNSDSQSDFMPAEGGATVVEQVFDLVTVIGNADNVTANIDEYITLATKADVAEAKQEAFDATDLAKQEAFDATDLAKQEAFDAIAQAKQEAIDAAAAAQQQETVYELAGTEILRINGGIQHKTLTENTTLTESLNEGESITLLLFDADQYTVQMPAGTWVGPAGNSPPEQFYGIDVMVLTKISGITYLFYVGHGVTL